MNPARMAKRCPGAIDLGGTTLYYHRVAERLYADTDFAEGTETGGVLYVITEEHLRKQNPKVPLQSAKMSLWKRVSF